MRVRPVPALLVFVAIGCSNPSSPEVDEVPQDAVAFVALDFEEALNPLRYFSGYDEPARLVIRREAAWARVWQRAATSASSHSLPRVDFGHHMIIFAAMGSRTSTGYMIGIEQLYRRGDDIFAVVHETSPGPGCGTGDAITAPVTAALVPRIAGRVYFVERKTVNRCI